MSKRLAITGVNQVDLLDYEDAPLEADQVLVQTELASGKHGTTMGLLDNRTFGGQRFDADLRLFVEDPDNSTQNIPSRENPWNLGTTGVGVVSAMGENVSRFQVGDRVFGLMDVRQTNIRKEYQLWHLGTVDPYLALCVEPSYVSFHCIREANVLMGDSVVIIGLGALGLLAVRMARAAGAETVIAVDPLPSRLDMAKSFGADVALNALEGDVALSIHEATQGKGVDVAIELSGVYAGLNTAIRSARVGGTICSAGFYQGEANNLWLGREWHHNRLTMIVPHGCGWGHTPRDYPRWDSQRAYDTIVRMMEKQILTAPNLVNLTLSLNEGTQVLEIIRTRPEVVKYAVDFTR